MRLEAFARFERDQRLLHVEFSDLSNPYISPRVTAIGKKFVCQPPSVSW